MAKSMRAWCRAADIIKEDGTITCLGKRLFVDYDPFLERGDSVAFLHWKIASNNQRVTAAAWVFNLLLGNRFTVQDAVSGFRNFLSSSGDTNYAEGTLHGDMETVLRMHSSALDRLYEDVGDRFFAQLRLLDNHKHERHQLFSRTWVNERIHISDRVFEHALLSSLAKRQTASSALSALYFARDSLTSPGAVFGLTKDGFFAHVERICGNHRSGLSLSTMPGEDALLTAQGELARQCVASDIKAIDSRFFERTH